MGLYNNGIYGIRIYTFNAYDLCDVLFEQKYDILMNDEQKREAFTFYENMNKNDAIFFKIYSECTSKLEPNHEMYKTYMTWSPFSLEMFMKYFSP